MKPAPYHRFAHAEQEPRDQQRDVVERAGWATTSARRAGVLALQLVGR